jgi:hypothetical protein
MAPHGRKTYLLFSDVCRIGWLSLTQRSDNQMQCSLEVEHLGAQRGSRAEWHLDKLAIIRIGSKRWR